MKKCRRIISFILSFALIISLLPTTALFAADKTVTVDFTEASAPHADCSGTGWALVSSESKVTGSSGYDVQRSNGLQMGIANDDGASGWNCLPWLYPISKAAESKWTIEVDLGTQTPGYYKLDMKYATVSVAGGFYVYADDNYAGYVNCYEAGVSFNTGGNRDGSLNTVYLTPDANGKVKIAFMYAGTGGAASGQWRGISLFKSLTLTPVENYTAPTDYAIVDTLSSSGEIDMSIGDSINFTAYLESPTAGILRTNGYKSDRTEDSDNNFKVSISGTGAALTDGNAIDTQNALGTEFDGTYNGTLVAQTAGVSEVKITATANGKAFSKTVKVTVHEGSIPAKKVTVDFTEPSAPHSNCSGTGWALVSSESKVTANAGYDVQRSNGLQMGIANDDGASGWNCLPWLYPISKAAESKWTIEVNLGTQTPGYYKLDMKYATVSVAGGFYIYADDNYAGYVNCYEAGIPSNTGGNKDASLNTIYLTPDVNGKVKIAFMYAGTGGAASGQWRGISLFKSLTLTPVEDYVAPSDYKLVDTLPETVEMYIGDTVNFTAYLESPTAGVFHTNGYKSDRTEDADNNFKVSISGNAASLAETNAVDTQNTLGTEFDGTYNGTLVGDTAGVSEVKISATANGKAFSKTVKVTVIDGAIPPSTVTLDFTEANISASDPAGTCNGTGWKTLGGESKLASGSYCTLIGMSDGNRVLRISLDNSDASSGWNCLPWLNSLSKAASSKWTIEVDLGTRLPGYYNLSLDYSTVSNGGVFYVYADDEYAGMVNCYGRGLSSGQDVVKNQKLKTVYLTPDSTRKVKIIFAYTSAGNEIASWLAHLLVNKLTLTPASEYTPDKSWQIKQTLSETDTIEMYCGQEIDFTAYAINGKGEKLNVNGRKTDRSEDSDNIVKVTVGDSNILSLSGKVAFDAGFSTDTTTGNSEFVGTYEGSVKAVGEGETTVVITAADGGETITKTITVKSVDDPIESVTAILESDEITVGGGSVLTPVIKLASGKTIDPKTAETEFTALTDNITVSGSSVIAKAEGNAKIHIKSTFNNVSAESDIEFEIKPFSGEGEFIVDLTTKSISGNHRSAPSSWVTEGFEVVTAKTTESIDSIFNVPTVDGYKAVGIGCSYMEWPLVRNAKNEKFTINVNVPKSGWYSVNMLGVIYSVSSQFAIYVNGEYVGDYNFHDNKGGNPYLGEEKKLGTVYLAKGKAEIGFHAVKNYYSGYNFLTPVHIRFVPATETYPAAIESKIPSALSVGEYNTFDAKTLMSDGNYKNFGYTVEGSVPTEDNIIEVASSDSSVVEVSEVIFIKPSVWEDYSQTIDPATSTYKLTAKKSGSAEIEIKATVGGKIVTMKETVVVSETPVVSAGLDVDPNGLFVGDKLKLSPFVEFEGGRISSTPAAEISYEVLTPDIVRIENGEIFAISEGNAEIAVSATFGGKTVRNIVTIPVKTEGLVEVGISAGGSQYIRLTDDENDTAPLYIHAISNLGNELDLTGAEITAESLSSCAVLDEDYNIFPKEEGKALFSVKVILAGREVSATLPLTVAKEKTGSTYYTPEKVAAVRENVKKYTWAENSAKKAINGADSYVENLDIIYDLIHSEGIPRNFSVGIASDQNKTVCRYCGVKLGVKYGTYPWLHSALQNPWKVKCPDCKSLFPSNDFGSFYKLGLNEYGEFSRLRALDAHRQMLLEKGLLSPADDLSKERREIIAKGGELTPEELAYYGYGIEGGYLYNKIYKSIDSVETALFREGEKVETWGVDDGFGYIPRKPDGTPYTLKGMNAPTTPERHVYIAEYLFYGLWRSSGTDTNGGILYVAIQKLLNAYYYTGDVKYGRALAVLIDRIADFYEDMDMTQYDFEAWRASDTCQGKVYNHNTWENGPASYFARAYDLVYDLYDDEWVLNYIANKGQTVKFRDAKNSASQIRTHIEDGILRAILEGLTGEKAAVKGRALIGGNFGYPQSTNALAAVILDTYPDTAKWLDYLMSPGWNANLNSLGGGIEEKLVNVVDRDGHGEENSEYNVDWLNSLISVSENLESYDRYEAANFYNMPKFVRMFYSYIPLMSTYYTPEIGDSSSTLGKLHWMESGIAQKGWEKLGDPIFAQVLYYLNGNSAEGLHYGETVKNPERLEDEVRNVIETYGELNLSSELMSGFGFAMLRSGGDYTKATTPTAQDTRRNVWMYFGRADGHGHFDTLNLGMTAFGLNFMPDHGYPEETGTFPVRLQWTSSTLSHNTVMVNEIQGGSNITRSRAQHFDDDGIVGVMDVDASKVYDEITDIYRRSVVTVKVDDENSYTVDFFRIVGGNDHLYSFHASSDEIAEITGLDMKPQADENGEYVGSYAGADVPCGEDPNSPQEWEYETVYPRGYTWVDKVDRDTDPSEKFEIDFKIKDFKKAISNSSGLRLRMTMLDGGNRDGRNVEVATGNGYAPNKAANKQIPFFRYVFVKHSAESKEENLKTTFTTVFEPYRNNRYIASIDELDMQPINGTPSEKDAYKALRIEHTNRRVDYVFYSTNNNVTFEVETESGKLAFAGFAGVYTVQNGMNTYKYLHDGTVLGESTGVNAAITGTVESFTDDISFSNSITIRTASPVSSETTDTLSGKYVIVENSLDMKNGAYKIEGATADGNTLTLDIGNVTLIEGHRIITNPDAGFIFNIENGQNARIPLTFSEKNLPKFVSVPQNLATSAESAISTTIVAESPLDGVGITYRADTLPRGATFDETSGKITWKPTSSQIGNNHFAITAIDDFGRENTLHFVITVYGSTTGGGGGATTPNIPQKPDTPTEPEVPTEPETPTEPEKDVRFVDLGNHAWAESSINALADEGIIKGTGENTFSPANNITRADFAILLVRAFKLESDNTENFSDVLPTDYFAEELAVARNTGLVNGIGENKFAPRNNITRQDMMVIVYRALTGMNKLNVGDGVLDVPQESDFDQVADYAKEAVSALINAKLINGKNGLIDPMANTTRAEVAVLIKRILDYVK